MMLLCEACDIVFASRYCPLCEAKEEIQDMKKEFMKIRELLDKDDVAETT